MSQKLTLFAALASAAGNKDLINQIIDAWHRLVAVTYGNEFANTKPLTENSMLEEYEKFRNVFPKFKITKKGLQISGLEFPAEKKKK